MLAAGSYLGIIINFSNSSHFLKVKYEIEVISNKNKK